MLLHRGISEVNPESCHHNLEQKMLHSTLIDVLKGQNYPFTCKKCGHPNLCQQRPFYFHVPSPMPYNKILLNVNLLSNNLCLYTAVAVDLQSYTQHIKSELLYSMLSFIVIYSSAIVV